MKRILALTLALSAFATPAFARDHAHAGGFVKAKSKVACREQAPRQYFGNGTHFSEPGCTSDMRVRVIGLNL